MQTVKLYLKSRRGPIILEFNNEATFEKYMEALKNDNIVRVGAFAFAASEFRYQIVFEKK